MAKIYEFDGVVPVVDPSAFVHPEAVLIGDVVVGSGCYIAPFASLRADFGSIVIQEGANIQDSCTVHTFPGKTTLVEADGHVGHGAILHGCTVKKGALIGMNAVVMDGAVVGAYAFVGAGSFVKAGFEVPANYLAAGSPARNLRELTEKELSWKANGTRLYQRLAQRSLSVLKPSQSMARPEEHRKRVSWEDSAAKPLYELKE